MQDYETARQAMREVWSLYTRLDGQEKEQAYKTMRELTSLMSMLEQKEVQPSAATPDWTE